MKTSGERLAAAAYRSLACAGARLGVILLWSLCAALAGGEAKAQALESVLSTGALSTPHAKLEEDCQKCHVRFDRNAQDRLCMDCHKDVGQDLRSRTGFHGRMKSQSCRSCHSEHKGRGFALAVLDKSGFDHAQTSFMLRDAHRRVECATCHVPGKGFRIAARDCAACHRKDDVHKGSLGAKCADCHSEASWKGGRFDHATTRFPLTGKHGNVKCVECHKDGQYKETPKACVACHRKADKHRGNFGEKCETCHLTSDWKGLRFNHDTATRYALLGKHRATRCESCHTGPLYHDKLPTACVDCHRKDDKHKGSLGSECARCHSERDWKEPAKFNHDKTDFRLAGAHATV
ncbi:MAG: cytochrome c3 family protein, partial [Candidatus Nanopelagicales bacterium]